MAAIEQMKITEIRLRQVLEQPVASPSLETAERRTGQTRAHLGEDSCVIPCPVADCWWNRGSLL